MLTLKSNRSYSTIEDEEFLEFVEDSSNQNLFTSFNEDDQKFIRPEEKKLPKVKSNPKLKKKNSSKDIASQDTSAETSMPEPLPQQVEYSEVDSAQINILSTSGSSSILSMNRHKQKGSKTWVHPPDSLRKGHIVYNVKFLGQVDVDQPKGTEVVREAITKMKFNKQLKKAEGQKPPRVEMTISVDGVTLQDIKTKRIFHQYPLHRISYCADDKTDKRMLTFIAKEADKNQHKCFVLDSDKCAEEITLTIGQAFDLAYKKFMDSSSKDIDMKKQYLLLQKKVQTLTEENLSLKAKVADLERKLDSQQAMAKPSEQPIVGRRLENLILDDHYKNGDVYSTINKPQPTTNGQLTPTLAPPPPIPNRSHPGTPISPTTLVDVFGLPPFNPVASYQVPTTGTSTNPFQASNNNQKDPFGMDSFNPQTIDQQIQNFDRELMDLQTGFSQGLSIGTNDFSLADLDPLH